MTHIDNGQQYEAWNNDSGQRWVRDADRRDRIYTPVAKALLSAARLRPGERVLDIGCGCGATTLAAARIVEPGGTVTGIDLSGLMLDVARRRQDTGGATNVTFVQGDAQTHTYPEAFEVAISRFGSMFFADPAAAFANIASGLHPGGRLALATWQPLAANDWLTIPGAALLRYATMPAIDHDGPGMFAQSEPDTVRSILAEAGYIDVDLEPAQFDLIFGTDVDDAIAYLADSSVARTVLATVPDHQRATAMDAVRAALADYTDDDGVHLGAAIWIITATRHPHPNTT